MAWRYDIPKCPVSPADRCEFMKPSSSDTVKCRWPACEDDADCMNGCRPPANGRTRQMSEAKRNRQKRAEAMAREAAETMAAERLRLEGLELSRPKLGGAA